MNETDQPDSLIKRVLKNGDTSSYFELRVASMEYPIEREMLNCAWIMAEKYHYLPAYKDVYYILVHTNTFKDTIIGSAGTSSMKYVLDAVKRKEPLSDSVLISLTGNFSQ